MPYPWRGDGARTAALAAAIALLTACGSGTSPEDVEDSYGEYRIAVVEKDGEAAAELVSSATLDYYAGLRDLALDADKRALAKARTVDQLAVLSMRSLLPVAQLRGATPERVVAAAVEEGVISEGGGGATTALTKVEVSGDEATGQLAAPGGASTLISFTREDDTWKVDLTSLLRPAENALAQAARQQNLEPQAMLEQVMTARVGEPKAQALWTPPGTETGK